MVHIVASLAFMLIAFASAGLIAFTLVDARIAILSALGIVPAAVAPIAARRISIRTVGRQTVVPTTMAARRAA
ncbi:MAG: hypothetical protein JWO65_2201 [Sphingomonas bacterium]|nr:hypothetical protein [Sphingomonas bacterium]